MGFYFKYILFLLAFSFVPRLSLLSQTEEPLVTEIQITKGDSIYKNQYIYNEENAKTLATKYVKIGKSWFLREQTEWYYSQNNCTEQQVRTWKNNSWNLNHLIKFEYQDGLIVNETHCSVKDFVETPSRKTEYIYNNGKLAEKNSFTFENDIWRLDSKINYSYLPNSQINVINLKYYISGLLSEEEKINYSYNTALDVDSILTQKKTNDEWVNSTLQIYYYSPGLGLKTAEISKEWDSIYDTWNNLQIIDYKYNASNKLIEEDYRFWKTAFWKTDLFYTYHYDTNGFLLKKTTYLPIYNDYRPISSIIYSNFEFNRANTIEAKYEFWGGEAGDSIDTFIPYQFNNELVINSGSKINISYIPVYDTGKSDFSGIEKKNSIKVYPNPSKGIFYYTSENYEINKWVVRDLNGKTLLTNEKSKRSGAIDLGNFKPGVYILQVITSDGVKTQKLMREGEN